ncbi:hypothetical protein ACIRS1_03990 [Kitasatospora sp. NPDC101176]|uniref:hypothetical protein n=1 Tax=Kitasatospora sp. NPDC101176 TaxID=3364099 RepID=UPI0037FF51F8
MNRQPLTRGPSGPRTGTQHRVTAQRPDARAGGRPPHRRQRAAAGVLAAVAAGALVLAGCSSGSSPSSVASSAVSAVEKGASAAASAASALGSAAGGAGSALASAEARVSSALASAGSQASSAVASASSAIAGIKGGLDAEGDVTVDGVTSVSGGKAQAALTVTNHGQQSYRYLIQVNFTDDSGQVQDATVVTVQDVAAGQTAQAVASSNRDLSGTVKAVVANAVRY